VKAGLLGLECEQLVRYF